jgi:ribosomal protein S27AE
MADLSLEGAFAEAWVVLTSDSLAVVEGPAVASGGKHGLTPWRETRFRSHRLDEIEQLNAESMPLGGLLSARINGAGVVLCRHTNSAARRFGIYIKLFSEVKDGEELTDDDFADDRAPKYCPKCGLLYPDQERAVCPRCLDKRSLFARVLSFAPRYRVPIALILACMVASSALRLLAPFVSGRILFDEVLVGKGRFGGRIAEAVLLIAGTQLLARIAIARALLHDPRILILDEATSSVDTETEQQIQEALARLVKHRTTFAIAHRLSTPRNAHRIMVIEKGRLAELGTHESLLRARGIYYNLVMKQLQTSRLRAVAG